MTTNRIAERFSRNAGKGALLPYFTSGFPDSATSAEFICVADALGATAVEIGIPYSDSIADGPVIQESFNYVLEGGQTLEDTFDLVSHVRPSVTCAMIAMVSYSIVHKRGVEEFMRRAASAGFDGIIVPDVPVEEAAPLSDAAGGNGLCHVGLVAPTTSPARREAIARASSGFIYQIAVAGTTGERPELPSTLPGDVHRLRELSGLPVCVGFGVSTARHVRSVLGFADGAIVGSAIIRRIADGLEEGLMQAALVELVSEFLSELATGTAGGGD